MVVKDRTKNYNKEDSNNKESYSAINSIHAGQEKTPMWGRLVRLSGQSALSFSGFLAVVCAVQYLKESEKEHTITKRLLVQHVWNTFRDEH